MLLLNIKNDGTFGGAIDCHLLLSYTDAVRRECLVTEWTRSIGAMIATVELVSSGESRCQCHLSPNTCMEWHRVYLVRETSSSLSLTTALSDIVTAAVRILNCCPSSKFVWESGDGVPGISRVCKMTQHTLNRTADRAEVFCFRGYEIRNICNI